MKLKILIWDSNDIDPKVPGGHLVIKNHKEKNKKPFDFHSTAVFGVLYNQLNRYIQAKSHYRDPGYIVDKFYSASAYREYKTSYFSSFVEKHFDYYLQTLEQCKDVDFVNMSFKGIPNFDQGAATQINKVLGQVKKQRGTIFLAAAGNGGAVEGNQAIWGNSPHVITIAGYYSKKSEIASNPAILITEGDEKYSAPSENIWFSVPGQQVTFNTVSSDYGFAVESEGSLMQYEVPRRDYERITGKRVKQIYVLDGSSMACPAALAEMAIIKYERPDLNSDDIVDLLVASSKELDVSALKSGWSTEEENRFFRTFERNKGRGGPNNLGYLRSKEFGFGAITDKERLAAYIKTWKSKTHERRETLIQGQLMKQENGLYYYSFNCEAHFEVEHAELFVSSEGAKIKDLSDLQLVSPAGTRSVFFNSLYSPKKEYLSDQGIIKIMKQTTDNYYECPLNVSYTSLKFYKEPTRSTDSLSDSDHVWIGISNLPLKNPRLKISGSEDSKDDTYLYNDDLIKAPQELVIHDTDGGKNVLNCAAYTLGKIRVDLDQKNIEFFSPFGSKIVKITAGQFKKEDIILGPKGGEILG